MSVVINFLSARFLDFGRGYGLALFFGVPIWALLIASQKQDFFSFASAREVIAMILWLTGLLALTSFVGLTKLRIKKLGKDGVEFDYAAEAITPKDAMDKAAVTAGKEQK